MMIDSEKLKKEIEELENSAIEEMKKYRSKSEPTYLYSYYHHYGKAEAYSILLNLIEALTQEDALKEDEDEKQR